MAWRMSSGNSGAGLSSMSFWWRRCDGPHALGGDGPGEVGVPREEAVSGVHGLGAAAPDHVEDGLCVQVALGRSLAPQGVRLVGHTNVHGVSVEVGEHGDARDPELAKSADDPHRDLSAVGYEDLLEHERSMVSASI